MAKGKTWGKFHWPMQARPVLRRAGWFPFRSDIRGRPYEHSTAALHQHFYHGVLSYQGGPSILLKPGDVTYSPPQTVTTYDLKTEGYHWCLHFDPIPIGEAGQVEIPLHLVLGKAGGYVTEKMRSLSDLHVRSLQKPKDLLIRNTIAFSLQELILWMALNSRREIPKIGSRLESGLAKARGLLDENFRNPPSPAEIADAAGLNQNYLAAHFKEQFGQTMDAYLLRRRLDVASHLLATTSLSIKEVAYESGIPDAQYFNKQFRRILGVSPSLYRQSHGPGPR